MYNENRTQLDAYWQEQDRRLDDRQGNVDVGPMQSIKPRKSSTDSD
jgi:hypothetical protein